MKKNNSTKVETATKSTKSIYEIVADKFIAALEAGTCPWHKPWSWAKGGETYKTCAVRWTNDKPYSMLNQCLLSAGRYITFKQITENGAHLKKGAKSYSVYESFHGTKKIVEQDEEGNDVETEKSYWSFRFYPVYNAEDVEGLPEKPVKVVEDKEPDTDDAMKATDELITLYMQQEGIEFHRGSNDAYYAPSKDMICVPALKQYKNAAEYYSTTLHEMTHSTGSEKRLSRKGITDIAAHFGTDPYAQEELVAEMGAAFLMAQQGIDSSEAFDNSAAYLKGWASRFKDDAKMIVIASQQAEKAADYILNRKAV